MLSKLMTSVPAIVAAFMTTAAAPAQPGRDAVAYVNQKYGFSLRIPADAFTPEATRNSQAGGMWMSRDGQSRLVAAAQVNESAETLQSYRKFLIETTYDQATFDYAPMRDNWFVLSGIKDGKMFYERVTFACGGRFIYGWQMFYPVAERGNYDRIVEQIHRSFRVGQGEDGRCG